jgi:hypothetical protein
MKTTKLTLAVFLLLNLNQSIRLQDPEDQLDEIDDTGLTSLGSLAKQ